MARVTTHLSVSDLEREYRVAKEATAARHYQAIWLLAKGHTVPGVAEAIAAVPLSRLTVVPNLRPMRSKSRSFTRRRKIFTSSRPLTNSTGPISKAVIR